LRGPTQPRNLTFVSKWQSGQWRSFQQTWFDEFDWLEYSESRIQLIAYIIIFSLIREILKKLVVLCLQ